MRTLSIVNVDEKSVVFNPEKVIMIAPNWVYDKDDNETHIPVWDIRFNSYVIKVFQSQYDIESIRMAMETEGFTIVPQKPEQPKTEEKEQETPAYWCIERWDFKYKPREEEDWCEARDFVADEQPCYFMDGDPLTSVGLLLGARGAAVLIDKYGFDNPVRNLAWIELDNGRTALLMNNRAEE